MSAPFAVALALLVHETRWGRKALLLAVAALVLFLTIIGLERGPWLGMIAVMSVVAFLRSKKIFAFLVVILVASATFSPVKQRALSTVKELKQGSQYSRFQIWSVAPEIVSQYPYGRR